jgi:hypothetical protein
VVTFAYNGVEDSVLYHSRTLLTIDRKSCKMRMVTFAYSEVADLQHSRTLLTFGLENRKKSCKNLMVTFADNEMADFRDSAWSAKL